jgi:hypothetical protein
MQLPPTSVTLSWPESNYVNPEIVRGPGLLAVTWLFYIFAVLAVGLRIFIRIRSSKTLGAGDVVLLPAILSAGGCAILTSVAMAHWGWNRHIWDVPSPLVVQGLKATSESEKLASERFADDPKFFWNACWVFP